MNFLFEILFDKGKSKKAIDATKREVVDMLIDVEKQAKKTSKAVDSVTSGIAAQRKFKKDVKHGDAFSQMAASRDSNFRKTLNEALASGMLSKSDLKSKADRNSLMSKFASGRLASDLAEWRASMRQQSKATKEETVVTNNANKSVKNLTQSTNKLQKFFNKISSGAQSLHIPGRQGTSWGANPNLLGGWTSRMRYQLLTLLTGGASIYGAINLGKSVFNNGAQRESDLFRNSVAFGNKGNGLAAMQMLQKMGINGTPFKNADMMEAFKTMMEGGVDPRKRKNFNLYGNIAGATGQSLSKVSGDLNSSFYGDSGVLRQYGVSNKQIFALDRMVNQRPDARKSVILGILSGDKRYKNGMRDFANSWVGMQNQISNHWDAFKQSIIGNPEDKNSLYSAFKNTVQKIIDWLTKNQERIKRFGMAVGVVLKWVLRQVTSFMRWVAHGFERILKKTDGSTQQFKDKMAKMVLWLELTKEKLIRFFEKWGWLIKWIVRIWVASKIVNLISGGFGTIFKAAGSILGVFKTLGSVVKTLGGFFMRAIPGLSSFNLALAAVAGSGVAAVKIVKEMQSLMKANTDAIAQTDMKKTDLSRNFRLRKGLLRGNVGSDKLGALQFLLKDYNEDVTGRKNLFGDAKSKKNFAFERSQLENIAGAVNILSGNGTASVDQFNDKVSGKSAPYLSVNGKKFIAGSDEFNQLVEALNKQANQGAAPSAKQFTIIIQNLTTSDPETFINRMQDYINRSGNIANENDN